LGGGIRDLETIERYLDMGVTYVIIGTAAVKVPGFLHEACDAFPGHIYGGTGCQGGKVRSMGWSKLTGHDVADLAQRFEVMVSKRSYTPTLGAMACCPA